MIYACRRARPHCCHFVSIFDHISSSGNLLRSVHSRSHTHFSPSSAVAKDSLTTADDGDRKYLERSSLRDTSRRAAGGFPPHASRHRRAAGCDRPSLQAQSCRVPRTSCTAVHLRGSIAATVATLVRSHERASWLALQVHPHARAARRACELRCVEGIASAPAR